MTGGMETSNEVFGLLNLPPELWLKIGKYVLDNTPKVKSWPSNYARRVSPQAYAPLRQPAITRTCYALRIELLPLFYQGHIRFRFYDSHNGGCARGSPQIKWLSAIGATNRRCLKNIELLAVPSDLEGNVIPELCGSLYGFVTRFDFDVELGMPITDIYGSGWEGAVDGEIVYPLIFR
ncbi:hypothetical protein LTR17_006102 [Elasticomyces elasticus]|nr:hypothetical protein LTR17_006102 [Elasticomyces elasticus]